MWTSLRFMPRILQRPKVLMFLSVITIFFLLNRSKYPEMLKAHVNFKGIERAVSFEKGDKVIMLRYLVMVAFSDVRLDKVPPDCVKLRKYDDSVHDYVPLPLDLKLVKDLKVQVKLPSTPEEMVSCGMKADDTGPVLFHPIDPNATYRLWNPATVSLLQRDPKNPNAINCNGSLKDMDYDTVASTMYAGKKRFAFLFKDKENLKFYVMNATDDGKNIVTAEYSSPPSPRDYTDSMKFKPYYYWSFTIFKNLEYKSLYLACSNDGGALLVPMNSTHYPDPRALFITNKYNPLGYS
ncbi:hypothetical protein ACROYT_G037257 [Oculina patagonica]